MARKLICSDLVHVSRRKGVGICFGSQMLTVCDAVAGTVWS